MPRGESSPVGTESKTPQGYTIVKTENDGWRLKHHIIAEETLGRPLRGDERVLFDDKDRNNFNPDNIVVETSKGRANRIGKLRKDLDSVREKLEQIETALTELESSEADD